MCNSNSGRTICLASCNYYNISYPIRQHPFSWKACKTFSLFFVHHAHYLTKTIFIFSAFNQISTLCSPPLSGATYYAFPLGKGNRRQAAEGEEYDSVRTEIPEQYQLAVLRFPNSVIDRNFRGICDLLEEKAAERMLCFS